MKIQTTILNSASLSNLFNGSTITLVPSSSINTNISSIVWKTRYSSSAYNASADSYFDFLSLSFGVSSSIFPLTGLYINKSSNYITYLPGNIELPASCSLILKYSGSVPTTGDSTLQIDIYSDTQNVTDTAPIFNFENPVALSGSLLVSGSINTSDGSLIYGDKNVVDWNNQILRDTSNIVSIDWKNRELRDTNNNLALSYTNTGSSNGVRLYGTASNALTSSAVNPLNQNVIITGSLITTNSFGSINTSNGFVIRDQYNIKALDTLAKELYDENGVVSINWQDRELRDVNNNIVLSYTDSSSAQFYGTSSTANAAGSQNEIQFNNNGILGSDPIFTWDGSKLIINAGDGGYVGNVGIVDINDIGLFNSGDSPIAVYDPTGVFHYSNSTYKYNSNTLSHIFTGSVDISGSTNIRSSLTASGLKYPIVDNGEESFMQTDGNGNLSLQYVRTIYEGVYNGEATQLTKGTPVYVSGSVGADSKVFRADPLNPSKMPAVYVVADNIDPADTGRGIALGLINSVNTTGYPAGTEIYLAPGGGWTSIRPTGSAIVQVLGYVTVEGAGGKGVVLNPGPANLPNINSGSVWVGNSSSVPTAILTSSLSVASASQAQTSSYISTLRAAGSNTQIQYNSGSVLQASPNFIYNYSLQSLQQGSNTLTVGTYSHAEGINTTAYGEYSHAEGIGTIASSSYSHTEGFNTQTISTVYSIAPTSVTVYPYDYDSGLLTGVNSYTSTSESEYILWSENDNTQIWVSKLNGIYTSNPDSNGSRVTFYISRFDNQGPTSNISSGQNVYKLSVATSLWGNPENAKYQYNNWDFDAKTLEVYNVDLTALTAPNGLVITAPTYGTYIWDINSISYASNTSSISLGTEQSINGENNGAPDLTGLTIASGSIFLTDISSGWGGQEDGALLGGAVNPVDSYYDFASKTFKISGSNYTSVFKPNTYVNFNSIVFLIDGSNYSSSYTFVTTSIQLDPIYGGAPIALFGEASHAGGAYTKAYGIYQTVIGTYNVENNYTDLFVIGGGTSPSNRKDIFNASIDNIVMSGSVNISGSLLVNGTSPGGSSVKAGSVASSSFGGSPLTGSVTFTTSFSNNNYAITVTGEDARSWTIQSKVSGSFVINSNSSTALTGPVYWIATAFGS